MRKDRLVLGAFLALVVAMPALLPSFYVTLLNYIGLYAMVVEMPIRRAPIRLMAVARSALPYRVRPKNR